LATNNSIVEDADMKREYVKPVMVRKGNLTAIAAASKVTGDTSLESDRRLKKNISRIGTTVHDLPLYRFSYLGSDKVFTGVMAQDVLEVMPEAVVADAAGFYGVRYGMLGIRMQQAA